MNILQIRILFIGWGEATVRKRANKDVHVPIQQNVTESSQKTHTPSDVTDLMPTPWSTAHKPHTPGWDAQTASSFKHTVQIKHNVCKTPGQIRANQFTTDEILNSWPELQTVGISAVLSCPRSPAPQWQRQITAGIEGENILISKFPSSVYGNVGKLACAHPRRYTSLETRHTAS